MKVLVNSLHKEFGENSENKVESCVQQGGRRGGMELAGSDEQPA